MARTTKSLAAALVASLAVMAVSPLAMAPADAATLSTPSGMAVDTAGNLYVANRSANTVNIYNTKYAFVAQISAGLNAPTAVAIGPTGQIFVTNYGGNNVTSYTPNLAQGRTVSDPNLTLPVGVFEDSLAELWVLDAAGTAHAYLDSGTPIGTFGVAGTTAFTPWAGNVVLWGSPHQGGTLLSFENAGEVVHGGAPGYTQGATPVARVGGAAVDARGQQYVTDNVQNEFFVVNASLSFVTTVTTPFQPFGIAVDSLRGRIFVSGGPFANKVAVFNLKPPYALLQTIQ